MSRDSDLDRRHQIVSVAQRDSLDSHFLVKTGVLLIVISELTLICPKHRF